MFSVFSTNYAYCDIQVNKQNSSSAMLQAKSLFHTPLNTEDTIISSYPLQLSQSKSALICGVLCGRDNLFFFCIKTLFSFDLLCLILSFSCVKLLSK